MNNNVWDYRVVRKESSDGSVGWYSIQEVYYDDETGEPNAQTIDLQVEGDTVAGMRTQLEKMINCLGQPVLDESDITHSETDAADYYTGPDGHYEKSMEERVLELEMKNAEMRDRLSELGDELASKNNVTDKEIEEWKKNVLKRGGI